MGAIVGAGLTQLIKTSIALRVTSADERVGRLLDFVERRGGIKKPILLGVNEGFMA
jgi:hypothetical protein